MNKILSAIVMLSVLAGFTPKAEAGLIVFNVATVNNHQYDTLDRALAIAIPVGFVATGVTAILFSPLSGISLLTATLLLGESLESKKSEIATALIKRYPALSDDQAAVNQLTNLIVAKHSTTKNENGNAMIVITEQDLATATASLDLSAVDQADLVNTLTK